MRSTSLDSSDDLRPRASIPREVLALAAVAFSVALGFGIVAPALPLFTQEFGVGTTAAGAVVSAFAAMRLIVGPFVGRFVDRMGERSALIAGLAVVALSSLLAGLSQTYPQLLVLRAIGGVGSAAFTVAATALIIRVAAPEVRGRAMSVQQSGFLIGGIVGPAAGGAVLGLSVRAPFFLYAGSLTLACLIALLMLPSVRRKRDEDRSEAVDAATNRVPSAESTPARESDVTEPAAVATAHPGPTRLRDALRQPGYRAALGAQFSVGMAVFGIRSAIVPLLLAGIGTPEQWIGGAFVVAALVQAALMWPAGKIVDTVGRRAALVGGSAITTVGLAMMGFGQSTWYVILALAVVGVGAAFIGPAAGALVGDTVPADRGRSGTVISVFQMSGDVGAVAGPIIAGYLVDTVSYPAAFGFGAVVIAVAALLGLQAPNRVPSTAPDNRTQSAASG